MTFILFIEKIKQKKEANKLYKEITERIGEVFTQEEEKISISFSSCYPHVVKEDAVLLIEWKENFDTKKTSESFLSSFRHTEHIDTWVCYHFFHEGNTSTMKMCFPYISEIKASCISQKENTIHLSFQWHIPFSITREEMFVSQFQKDWMHWLKHISKEGWTIV